MQCVMSHADHTNYIAGAGANDLSGFDLPCAANVSRATIRGQRVTARRERGARLRA